MPRLLVIAQGGAGGRRLLDETVEGLVTAGYSRGTVQEGGEWTALIAAGRSAGLFSTRQVTVVEEAELLGAFPEDLVPFLEGEGADEVFVLLYGGDTRKYYPAPCRERITFIKGEDVPFWPSKRRAWLAQFAAGKGIALQGAAAALLVDMIEDPEELRSRVEDLGAYAAGGSVTEEMVKLLAFDEGHSRVLRFLDAFCGARAAEVLSLLDHLKREPSVLPLLTALYNRIRPAVYASCFSKRDVQKVAALLKVRDYAGRMAAEAGKNYSPAALKALALNLAALSWKEKTAVAEGWYGFEAALLQCLGATEDEKKAGRA